MRFIKENYKNTEEHVYVEFDMPFFVFNQYTIYAKYVYNEYVIAFMNYARDHASEVYDFKNGPYNHNHMIIP